MGGREKYPYLVKLLQFSGLFPHHSPAIPPQYTQDSRGICSRQANTSEEMQQPSEGRSTRA